MLCTQKGHKGKRVGNAPTPPPAGTSREEELRQASSPHSWEAGSLPALWEAVALSCLAVLGDRLFSKAVLHSHAPSGG